MKIEWNQVQTEDEKIFLKTVVEYSHKAEEQYRVMSTSFYNKEWMQEVLRKYVGPHVIQTLHFMGGFEEAERQVILFGEEYLYHEDLLPISALKVEVKTGLGKPLSHRDFLGALLGLGIKRETIGDILLQPFGAYIMMTAEISGFVLYHLTSIGRYQKLKVEKVSLNALTINPPQTVSKTATVASLRADAVLAVGFGLSRSEVTKYIQGEKARVNGYLVKSSDPIKEGDTITLRGFGKIRLRAINGQTKKERIHITIEKFI